MHGTHGSNALLRQRLRLARHLAIVLVHDLLIPVLAIQVSLFVQLGSILWVLALLPVLASRNPSGVGDTEAFWFGLDVVAVVVELVDSVEGLVRLRLCLLLLRFPMGLVPAILSLILARIITTPTWPTILVRRWCNLASWNDWLAILVDSLFRLLLHFVI